MRKVTILVSAAGSINGVNVIKALRAQKDYNVEVIAIDSDANAAGLYLADSYEVAPRISDPSFRDFVLNVCESYGIEIIIPTHSVELPFYSCNQRLLNDRGTKLMVSPIDRIEICDDKLKLAQFLHQIQARQPTIYNEIDLDRIGEDEFPLFVKARFGSGSTHARKVSSLDELSFYLGRVPAPVVQEYVEGAEYTVNIISDYDGKVVGSVPLKRLKVKGGLAVVAQVELNVAMMKASKRIVEALGLIGPSNVQVIARDEELVFLEVNPRFASGGMPLATGAGLNIPLLMIKLMLGEPIGEVNIENGKKMVRYWDAVVL